MDPLPSSVGFPLAFLMDPSCCYSILLCFPMCSSLFSNGFKSSIDFGWVSIALSMEFEWIAIGFQLILGRFRWVSVSFSMEFERFAMHFHLIFVCFLMGLLNSSIGSPLFSIGFPLLSYGSPSLFYGSSLVF